METLAPSLAQPLANPFAHRRSPDRLFQCALRWAIRLGTYAVLVAAACIFLQIGIKGAQTVFT
ncbi:MAG: hypothetical protein PHQ12_04550, partial [Chthoniobacteraceae bacterium]|nr:hypothetical protein [Chthoniobacteraceae bacterium]